MEQWGWNVPPSPADFIIWVIFFALGFFYKPRSSLMLYFGEVREFATGAVVLATRKGIGFTHPDTIVTERRIWTGSEWAALGTKECDRALAAIRDDAHDPLAEPGALR